MLRALSHQPADEVARRLEVVISNFCPQKRLRRGGAAAKTRAVAVRVCAGAAEALRECAPRLCFAPLSTSGARGLRCARRRVSTPADHQTSVVCSHFCGAARPGEAWGGHETHRSLQEGGEQRGETHVAEVDALLAHGVDDRAIAVEAVDNVA